ATAYIIVCRLGANVAASDGDSCTVGTIEDDCIPATESEFFFCTDRYSWEWSQDVQQLPTQASDSLCLAMDSNAVDGLEQTELLVIGGCDAEFQEIGGSCESLSSSTRSYNPILDRFEERQSMPTERFRAAAVNASEYVYLFGGRNGNNELTCNVDRYDVLTGQWVQLDVMQEEHCYSDHSGVASEDGTIYIFGGFTADYQTSGTVVKVEVSGDNITFSTTTPMGLDRGDHSCILLPATTEVFCIGGYTFDDEQSDFQILKSVERFDISTQQWDFRASMVNPRADFGASLLNGRITVVGGEDTEGPMDDVEWYDPEADCWVYSGNLFDLPFKRLRYCAATMQTDNRIYIFGGQALDDTSDEVYTILDTVNWYQEVLVDQLTPSRAASS
ncbi:unnamed protein product, partial [Ascophyllum nodosum]